jgi:hypothetical protein
LGQFGEAAAPAAPALGIALSDPAPGVHMPAVEALGKIGAAGLALTQVINDSADWDDVRYDASKAREKVLGPR